LSTIDRICDLLEQQNKSQKDLADHLGIGKNRITDWKAGRIHSYTKYLPQIAEFLGVSVDHLLGNTSPAEASLLPAELLAVIATFSEEEMRDLENYVHYIVSKRK
jgi:transcriptional regulator with XRE-family HTH domain